MSDWLGLRDKVCVVTGAASGIGRGIVLAFAAAGSKVVALDQEPDGCARTADEVKRRGATAMPLFCDVTERRPGRRQCGRGGRRGLAYRMAAAVDLVDWLRWRLHSRELANARVDYIGKICPKPDTAFVQHFTACFRASRRA